MYVSPPCRTTSNRMERLVSHMRMLSCLMRRNLWRCRAIRLLRFCMLDQGVQGNESHAFSTCFSGTRRQARCPSSRFRKSQPVSKVRRSAANPNASAHVVIRLLGLQHNSHTTRPPPEGKEDASALSSSLAPGPPDPSEVSPSELLSPWGAWPSDPSEVSPSELLPSEREELLPLELAELPALEADEEVPLTWESAELPALAAD